MFYAPLEELNDEYRGLVETAFSMMERRSGARIPESSGTEQSRDAVKPLRLTIDPLTVWSRPLIAYAIITLAGSLTRRWLIWRYQVQYERVGGITCVAPLFLFLRAIPKR